MALTKEDLQAIRAVVQEELQPVKDDIADIKENLEEVRSTANSLVAWADNVSVVTQIKFPVEKVNNK